MLKYMEERDGEHFTAADIYQFFKKSGSSIGRTTVYRQLEELVSAGEVKKYVIDENTSACYEYIGGHACHPESYHMKCERCGKLIHLECDEIAALEAHIAEHHDFRLDPLRTVFYGICRECEQT